MTIPQDQTVPTEAWFDFIVEHRLASNSQDQILKKLEQFVIAERRWPGCLFAKGPYPQSETCIERYVTRTRWQDGVRR